MITNNACIQCGETESGKICTSHKSTDGLPCLCIPKWSKDKHYPLAYYLDMFSGAFKSRKYLYYIDLFSGPGICIVKESGEELPGSPIIALEKCFNKYIFAERDEKSFSILKKRCNEKFPNKCVVLHNGDCNLIISEIIDTIPKDPYSIGIAFIDPFGTNIDFSTIQKLSNTRNLDLIINFSAGMGVKRNMNSNFELNNLKLGNFLGDDRWKEKISNAMSTKEKFSRLYNLYKNNLKKLGYLGLDDIEPVVSVKNSKNVPLYYLIYTSKNDVGINFWHKSLKYDNSGQRRLL
jgi:three-Cys-motif partner protein